MEKNRQGIIYQTVSEFIIDVLEDDETKKNPEMVTAISKLLSTTGYF